MGRADRRIGGGRRPHPRRRQGALAAAARRPRGRLSSYRIAELEPRRARLAAHRPVSSATCETSRTFARSRCRSSTRSPTGRSAATWGEWLDRFAALARARAARPERVLRDARRSAADGGRRPGRARRSARRAARSPRHARLGSAGAPLRPRVRRHAASGARPRVPRRVRAGPRRARRSAAAARGSAAARRASRRARCARSSTQDERGQRRAPAAEDRDRRGDASGCICRIRASTSAKRARACRRSTRSTSCARSPGACRTIGCSRRSGRRRRREPRVAGAEGSRSRRSTISSTTSPCSSRCSTRAIRAAVKGHAHYLLGLNEALRRSVISRWARGRRAWSASDGLDQGRARHASGARCAAAAAAAVFAVGAAAFRDCPYQFLLATIYRLEPWDEPEPLVRMDPLTRGSLFHQVQAEFYRAMEHAGALPVTRDGVRERGHDARRGARPRRRRIRRAARAGDRARLARRDRRAAARSRHLGAEARRRRRAGGRRTSSSASG